MIQIFKNEEKNSDKSRHAGNGKIEFPRSGSILINSGTRQKESFHQQARHICSGPQIISAL